MSFKPSAQQQAIFDFVTEGNGSATVEAVAGAGKTTTVVEALAMIDPTQNGYLLAFNKKMGDELKVRVNEMREELAAEGRAMANITAGTFHAAGLKLLSSFFSKRHKLEIVGEKKVKLIVEKIIRDNIHAGRAGEQHLELIPTVCGIVSMAKQRGFGTYLQSAQDDTAWAEMIAFFGLDETLPEGFNPASLIPLAKRALDVSNSDLDTIDYDDMIYMVIQRGLKLRYRYNWVIVDEAQDTNPVRRAFVRVLLADGGRVIAVGDGKQAIFGFTGADNDSLDQIAREFNCVRLPLTVTYRCPKAVVHHAQQWVSHIQSHESSPEGSVRTIPYRDASGQTQADFFDLVRPGDAVLCRFNKYLVSTCFELIRAGKLARIEGRSIGESLVTLSQRFKAKTLEALIGKVESYKTKEVAKALEEKKEQIAERIADQCETLLVLIERAVEQGMTKTEQLRQMILDLFDDKVVTNDTMVTLCSAHRSKGLEWNRVFILGRSELMPSPYAKQPWQVDQEINLIYVAVTRAKSELIEVVGVKVEDNKRR